ncbi:MAG: hypothetical protein VKK04_09200 [Synechococcales bacterium]|nr:hypothetical protein [Synechococcales bacterium]
MALRLAKLQLPRVKVAMTAAVEREAIASHAQLSLPRAIGPA